MYKNIGIFGGTFNPIHKAHIEMAKAVKEAYDMDHMFFIPSKLPPHKEVVGVDADKRLAMTELAVSELGDGYSVSSFEIDQEGISYSYITLKHFRTLYPDSVINFVAGTDIFATISSWQRYEDLFDLANFVIVDRDVKSFEQMLKEIPESLLCRVSREINIKGKYGEILLFEMPHIKVSSTVIRQSGHQGLLSKEYLTDKVYEYIVNNGLYTQEK